MTSAPHRITWSKRAARELRKLDPAVARRIGAAVGSLAETPTPGPPLGKAMKHHPGLWRLKIGDWRVIYRPDGDALVVLVLTVGHRREIYNRL